MTRCSRCWCKWVFAAMEPVCDGRWTRPPTQECRAARRRVRRRTVPRLRSNNLCRMSLRPRITGRLRPLRSAPRCHRLRLSADQNFGKQLLKNCRCGDLVMNRTAFKQRELPMRGKKPTTYRRIVTGNVNGKSVVQSDEPLLAYEFKTVPGYEHTLMWINPAIPDLSNEQRFDRYPDSVVPGPGGTSLHFVTFPPGLAFAGPSFDADGAQAGALVRPRGLADHFEKEDHRMHKTNTRDYAGVY